ncbi:hypothetical protein [Vibrio sp. S12_S33]|uniref:hypothetical protein n=1 Tax=Vibrio sp. S12_S33 TaxID=2720223 RepID=UPI001782F157|nr:hypothetical protein [Vibrio sp. S12_S33]MBD1567634.1 hypothetical protein [Vibrio sp. S12_S33]
MGSLDSWAIKLEKIGWFIPPYVNMQQLDQVLSGLDEHGHIQQDKLGYLLASIYPVETICAVFIEKYANTPFVKDYLNIIDNGIECHFLGLNYSSVGTLIPVIEGVARKLAGHRGVEHAHIKKTIQNLCASCKYQVVTNKLGAYEEVESMIDSFEKFVTEKLYSNSKNYPHEDNTNRNGIAHGAYSDLDFGNPVSFYKVLSLINFLSFLSAIDAGLSWFPPTGNEDSYKKSVYLVTCQKFSVLRSSYS